MRYLNEENFFSKIKRKFSKGIDELNKISAILFNLIITKFDKSVVNDFKKKLKITDNKFNEVVQISKNITNNDNEIKNSIESINEGVISKVGNVWRKIYSPAVQTLMHNSSDIEQWRINAIQQVRQLGLSPNLEAGAESAINLYQGNCLMDLKKGIIPQGRGFEHIVDNAARMQEKINNGVINDCPALNSVFRTSATDDPMSFTRNFNSVLNSDEMVSYRNEIYGINSPVEPAEESITQSNFFSENALQICQFAIPIIIATPWGEKFIYNILLRKIKKDSTKNIIYGCILSSGLVLSIMAAPGLLKAIPGTILAYKIFCLNKKFKNNKQAELLSYIHEIPFFNYNFNNKEIYFSTKCAQIINENKFSEIITTLNTKIDNLLFEDYLRSQDGKVIFYNLNINNINIMGFYDKGNSINFLINKEIMSKFDQVGGFTIEKIIKIIILSLKIKYKCIKQDDNNLLILMQNQFNDNYIKTFINTIANPNNNEFKEYLNSLNRSLNECEYLVNLNILNILNDNINIINTSQLSKINNYSGSFIVETDGKIKDLIISRNTNKTIPIIEPMRVVEVNTSNTSSIFSGGMVGAGLGYLAGASLTPLIDQFCDMYPSVSPIIKPLLANSKTSGAIIGSLIGMGMKPLASKLVNFLRSKK